MKNSKILIVTNSYKLANVYTNFLKQYPFFEFDIAYDINSAKTKIKILNPSLIILENNLLEGKGIVLLHYLELIKKRNRMKVIFVTTSIEIDAAYLGCFDYLIKPFSYDRLRVAINNYIANCMIINNKELRTHINNGNYLPIGIDKLTLKNMIYLFNSNVGIGFSASSLAKKIGISKTTSRRYLEYCLYRQYLNVEIETCQMGISNRIYYKNIIH